MTHIIQSKHEWGELISVRNRITMLTRRGQLAIPLCSIVSYELDCWPDDVVDLNHERANTMRMGHGRKPHL
jgi:hypothetical protein